MDLWNFLKIRLNFSLVDADKKPSAVARTPRIRVMEDEMAAVQGIPVSPPKSSALPPKPAAPVVQKDRDHDGDVDKPSVIDTDKGNHIDVTA